MTDSDRAKARVESGLTLIELAVTVAIVGILATAAVFMFSKSSDKARASEVAAMFAEFHLRQERYYAENGTYVSTGSSESDTWPTAPAGDDDPKVLAPLDDDWKTLRMTPGRDSVYCAYVAIAGDADDDASIGAIATSFGFTVPSTDWYYLVATCDWDDDSSVNSIYFAASTSEEIYQKNEGR